MSIPAILYDHVPINDLEDEEDGDAQKEAEGVSFYVSSMIHRTSAPREDGKNNNPFQLSRPTHNRKGNNESQGTNNDGTKVLIDTEIIDDADLDDRPMETIIEDIDFDYVLIPIPSPILSGDCDDADYDNALSMTSFTTKGRICNKIRTRGKALLGAVTTFSKSNQNWITTFWKENDDTYVSKCLSGCILGSQALLRPLQCYARDLVLSYSIYSSYDWVSETIVDGNRLILPGSCVSLDSRDSNTTSGSRRKNSYSGENHEEGTLIVPAGTDAFHVKHEKKSSVGVTSSLSSPWASKTIMVSAHDLLAVKHDRNTRLGDRDNPKPLSLFEAIEKEEEKGKTRYSRYYYRDDEYNMDTTTIMEATTQNIARQWTRALWKLVERKAKIWYCISSSYLRRSIQNAGCTFINSHNHLIQYYLSSNRQAYRALAITSNRGSADTDKDQSNSIVNDENRGGEWESRRCVVLSAATQTLSNRSFCNQKTSDEIINGCDFGTRSSESTCVIEMAASISKRRKAFCSAF